VPETKLELVNPSKTQNQTFFMGENEKQNDEGPTNEAINRGDEKSLSPYKVTDKGSTETPAARDGSFVGVGAGTGE